MNGAGFAGHVIHEEILAEVVGSREVGFAFAHLRDSLDEIDERIVAGEHEGVNHDTGALAFVDFFERFADDERIETEGVFVDAAVFEREGGRFSVGNHDDLAHVFALPEENALSDAKAFARVRVKRADLNAGEFAQGDFFGGIVEENEIESVAGILGSNEMRERHGDALGGSEAIFAVENHAVAAVEENDGGAGRVIFALVDHEVLVLNFDGDFGAVAADSVEKSFADVEIERVAKFIRAGDAAGFDAGGEVSRVVAAKAAAAERAEKILKSFEAEEVDGFVGDFETDLRLIAVERLTDGAAGRGLIGRRDLRRLLRIDEALLRHAFDEFVEKVADFFVVHRVGAVEHLANFFWEGVFVEEVAILERAEDGFAQGFHGTLGIEFVDAVILRFETGLQEEVAEALDELLEVDGDRKSVV